MKHRLRSPPCLIIEVIVLGKSAGIHRAELRTYAWPTVRAWFATIVESSPHKSASQIITFSEKPPPLFSSCSIIRTVDVIGAYIAAALVVCVNPAGAVSARRFCSDCGDRRESAMKSIQVFSLVIKSLDVHSSGHALSTRVSTVHRHRDGTRRIELVS